MSATVESEHCYLIVPGMVVSLVDGQRHWVGAVELMRLYGLRRSQCRIARHGHLPAPVTGLVVLKPRERGDYEEHRHYLEQRQEKQP